MSTAITPIGFTPEDLLEMPEGDLYELVDGRLVERDMGAKSSWVGGRLYRRLSDFSDGNKLGWVWPADNGYQCFPKKPTKVRRPDVSFIRFGRLPGEQLPEGFIRIAPDLAAEVISPNEMAYELDEKIQEYQEAGVRLIWVVNPHSRVVWVHRTDGTIQKLTDRDELNGEDVVPGFRCPVRDVLPPVPENGAATTPKP